MDEHEPHKPSAIRSDTLVVVVTRYNQSVMEQDQFMELVVLFPTFETDGAGIVSHGEELERIGKLCGYGNVIASLYFDDGELQLGIFAREGSWPKNPIEATSTDTPTHEIHQ